MEKAAVPPSEESTAQRKPSWRGTLDDIWIVKRRIRGLLNVNRRCCEKSLRPRVAEEDEGWNRGRKEEGKDSRGEDHLSVRRRTVTSRLQDGTALDCLGRAKFSSQGGARLGRSQSAGS